MIDFPLFLPCYIAFVVFVAAVMRGFCGFGFSMIVVILGSLIVTPAEIVPAVLVWEILASVVFFPSIWHQIAWKTLKNLSFGVVLGTPVGVWLLATIQPSYMIIAINTVACLCCVAILRGYVLRSNLSTKGILGTGLLSGLLNGSCANGGLPLILLFLSSPLAAATGRASLIAFFFFTDVWASVFAVQQGLVSMETFDFVLWGLPTLALGLWCGNMLFVRLDVAYFKRISMYLLAGLSTAALCYELVKLFMAG